MASLTVAFDFASDVQGFTEVVPGGPAVMSFDGAVGNPAGSLKSRLAGKSQDSPNNFWRQNFTFEGLGVPAGSTVTAIQSCSMQSKCTEFNHAARSKAGSADLGAGGMQMTLSSERIVRGVDSDWVTTTGEDKTGLSIASNQGGFIAIYNSLATGASNDAAVSLNQDQLTFTIIYS